MAQDDFLQKLEGTYNQAAPAQAPATAAAAPASAPVPSPEESGGVAGFLKDTGRAVVGGLEAAGRGAIQSVTAIDDAMMTHLTGQEQNTPPVPTMVADPTYGFNKVVKDITQYGVGFMTGGAVLKGAGMAAKGTAGFMGQSALGTGIVADPHQERLSNLLQQYPFLEKPMGMLAADPTDGAAEGKLKAALEDAFTTPVALGMLKAVQYGFKSTRGLFKSPKEAAAAEADLSKTLTELNDAAEAGTLKAEKYGDKIDKNLVLDQKLPSNVLTLPSQKAEYRQVNLNDNSFVVKEADHLNTGGKNPIEPEKVKSIQGTLKSGETSKLPPVDMAEDPLTGELRLLDGRHRVEAARAEGFTSITAKVNRDKNAKELVDELNTRGAATAKVEAKFGGEQAMAKAATKAEKANNAFNLSPEQYKDFTDRVKANMIEGDTNELFRSLPGDAFNYSKMTSKVQVQEVMKAMADVIEPNLKATAKEHMSFREMQSTAALFGSKPETMMANLKTWGVEANNMPATLLAAKSWAQSLSREIYRDARSIAMMGTGGKTSELEMMRKISVLGDIEGMMKSVQTAAARTTAAGRIRTTDRFSSEDIQSMLQELGGSDKIGKLAEKLAMTGGDPAKLTKLVRSSMAGKLLDSHNELWINSILSGISTHVVNISTAGANAFIKPGNIALGGLIRGDKTSVDAAMGTWKAMSSMFKDSWEMSRRAWEIERPLLSVTDKQLEIESTISAGNFNLNPESWLGQGVNYLGKLARIPSRFLGSEDEFFKQLSYRGKLHQGANTEAMALVREGKLDPQKMVSVEINGELKQISEVDAFIQKKFDEGFEYENLPELAGRRSVSGEAGDARQGRGADQSKVQYANEVTFTQNLKVPTWGDRRSMSEMIYQHANEHPLLRGTVLPFVKVPANLMREAMTYTPGVAQMRKQFWADMATGGERASEALGKMATGSMLLGGATMLAVEGKITGGAPTDIDVRNRMYEKGWQPYSFVFGDKDGERTYVPFARFDPFGLLFGIVGDIAQTFQHHPEDARHNVAAAATMAVANMFNSRSYLKGLVDTLDILSGGQGQDGIDQFNRILNSRAASYIPNAVRTVQPDTELKEIRSMVDAMLAKTPGFSQSVPAKRGYFGDKVMPAVGWPWHSILPTKPGVETDDPALLELARLSDGPSQAHFKGPEKRIGTLDLTKFVNAEGTVAYDRMLEKLNETDFHEKVNELVQSDRYKAGTDGDAFYPGSKQVMLKKLESKYHQKALDETLKEFESQAGSLGFDLREMYNQDRKNSRNSKHGRETTEIDRLLELTN